MLTSSSSHHELCDLLADGQLRFCTIDAHAGQSLHHGRFFVLLISGAEGTSKPVAYLVNHDLVEDRHELGMFPPLWWLHARIDKDRLVMT